MKDQRKTEIKVGITAIIAIVVLVMIFGWAKNYQLYGGQKRLSIKFESAAGLEKGDPVAVNGVRKGFVEDILISGNSAIVKAVLDSDVDIKSDASYAITMLDLMGGKKVEIKPGVAASAVDYSKVQSGDFSADIPEVMAMLGSVQGDLVNIIKDVQVTLKSVNRIIGDEQFSRKVKTSLDNLAEVSAKMNVVIEENRASLREISSNGARLASQSSEFFDKNRANIEKTINQAETLLKSSNELLSKLNSLVDETRGRNNNLGRLMYDETMMQDLKGTLERVKELTDLMKKQLDGKGLKIDANVDLF